MSSERLIMSALKFRQRKLREEGKYEGGFPLDYFLNLCHGERILSHVEP